MDHSRSEEEWEEQNQSDGECHTKIDLNISEA
jgi:hypothetical protein